MAEKLLRMALKEDRAPQESSSPVESHVLCLAQQLEMDASWLPVYHLEPEHVDVITAFVSSPEKGLCCRAAGGRWLGRAASARSPSGAAPPALQCHWPCVPISCSLFVSLSPGCQDEERKLKFLKSVAMLFRAATYNGLSQGLDLFCQRYKLAENIKVLLEEEPRDQLHTAVRRSAMFAMAEMSFVEAVLEGKEIGLLRTCFSSIFLLPPKEEMQDLKPFLYFTTMKGMDTMLVAVVLNSPTSGVIETMQSIFQMLLTFTTSERASVRERAVGRMRVLSFLLANYSSLKADPNEERHASCAGMQMPIIGQLLGHLLLLLSFKEEETSRLALDALCLLFQFKYQQRWATLTEENTQLQGDLEAETTSLRTSPSATHIIESFAEYLQPSERSDLVRVFIEATTDSSTFDKEAARSVLDMAKGNPDLWLVDVPKITSCIHKTLGCIKTVPARQSVESLMVPMADKCPQEVVTTLLQVAPGGDRYCPHTPRGLVPCGERGLETLWLPEPRNPAGHTRGAGPSIPPCVPAQGVSQAHSRQS
ncbi:maestro heat-like repeat-containing protein family member 7 [Patagioenas fasciata]|uniref:maestro heat-like repeat-containing protein family member 7 n=1 Tax=Patagioenas fasciata TaxID=372321 RepID=UPI003A9A522F